MRPHIDLRLARRHPVDQGTDPKAVLVLGSRKVSYRSVAVSEWIKLSSLRSTWWTVSLIVLSIIGMGAVGAVGNLVGDAADPSVSDVTGGSLSGVSVALLAVAVLGTVTVTGEYATGVIGPTLVAVPRRLPLVWAKASVAGVLTFVVSLLSVGVALVVAKLIMSTGDRPLSLTDLVALRSLAGSALYLALTAAIGSGFGWLLRSTAGGIAVLVAFLYIPGPLAMLLPRDLGEVIVPLVPSSAGAAMMQTTTTGAGLLPPYAGAAVFAGYAAVVLVLAALRLRQRDA